MNNLRMVLLGGAALAVMATGAQADELSALKSQLEMLQSRVNTLESAPATGLEGKSLLTFERGQGSNNWDITPAQDAANLGNADSGYTIAVTPTADMPAPIAEITVYGYVAAHLHYAFDGAHGLANSFWVSNVANTGGDHISLTAQQSRFGIKSKIDTAVGQIRTQIEGDFYGGGGNSGSMRFRLRHAVGHWDMTPNWTFTAGQTWNIAGLLPIGVSTVDFNGSMLTYGRAAQLRLTYTDGPLSWAVGIENPTNDSSTNMPNFASYVQYDIAGGHQFIVTGEIADWNGVRSGRGCVAPDSGDAGSSSTVTGFNRDICDTDGDWTWQNGVASNDELAWVIQAGANFNVADVATLTAGVAYGEGLVAKYAGEGGLVAVNTANDPLEAIAFVVGLSFALSETTTFNSQFSYVEALEATPDVCGSTLTGSCKDKSYKVSANVMWQPVKQMRMGWEVNWGEYELQNGTTEDGVSAMFGTWFFF